MKKAPINLEVLLKSRYTGKKTFINKFIRHWGTTTVDGVEVLTDKKYMYPSMDKGLLEIAKMLNFYDDIKNQKYEGVDSVWMYLNGGKSSVEDLSDELLVSAVREAINEYEAEYSVVGKYTLSVHLLDKNGALPELSAQGLIDIGDGYLDRFIVMSNYDNPALDTYARYMILDNRVIKNISRGFVDYSPSVVPAGSALAIRRALKNATVKILPSWVVEIEFSVGYLVGETDKSIKRMLIDAKYKTSLSGILKGSLGTLGENKSATSSALSKIIQSNNNPDIWYSPRMRVDFLRNVWYSPRMRVDFLRNGSVPIDDRIAYLISTLDTGYKKKKVKWYKKLLAVAVFVLAVVFAPPLAGSSLIVQTALAVVFASMVVSLTAYALAKTGDETGAMAFAEFNKTIEPIVKIAQVITVVNAITNFVNNAAKAGAEAALKEAGKEVTQQAIEQYITENLVSSVVDGLVQQVTNISFTQGVKIVGMVADYIYKNKLDDLQKDISAMESELAKQKEAEEANDQNDLAMLFSKIQFDAMKADWSMYTNIYDRPYEATNPALHIGNVQATTINALRFT